MLCSTPEEGDTFKLYVEVKPNILNAPDSMSMRPGQGPSISTMVLILTHNAGKTSVQCAAMPR